MEFIKKSKIWLYITLSIIFLLVLWLLPEWYVYNCYKLSNNKEQIDVIQSLRTSIISIGGGILVLVGINLTWRRTNEIQRQNDINVDNYQALLAKNKQDKETAEKNLLEMQVKNKQDKESDDNNLILQQFSKAAEFLNNDKIEARLSGIYLFEKIMNSSDDYHLPVIEILSAYVREQRNNNKYEVPDEYTIPVGVEFDKKTKQIEYDIIVGYNEQLNPIIKKYYGIPIEKDIQAILTVLGKRDRTMEKYKDEDGETNLLELINDLNKQTIDLIKVSKENNEDEINRIDDNIKNLKKKLDSINRIDLRNSNLYKAELMKLHFENANCTAAHFENANCTAAHFENADCYYAHFGNADCNRAHLENADCIAAHFENADCIAAHFENANCKAAHFENTDCYDAHFENTDFNGAYFENANCVAAHFENSKCIGTHFENTVFIGTHFENADCYDAHFENTDCYDAHFENVDCYDAHFENAIDLTSKQLSKAERLYGATGLSEEMIMEIIEIKPDIFNNPDNKLLDDKEIFI